MNILFAYMIVRDRLALMLTKAYFFIFKRMDEILIAVEANSLSDSIWFLYHLKMKVFKHTVIASEERGDESPALLSR